jgi:signal transduction histidine kinase
VLLVEDNAVDVSLLRGILDEHPAAVTLIAAPSLAAALDRLAQGGIDLILTDLRLPDSLEDQTVPILRANAPEVPIVVLSGLEDEAVALRMIEHGAQDYLVKGRIDHRALVRTIRYSLERHSWQEELRKAHDTLELGVAQRTAELADTAARLEDALFQLQQAQQRIVQQERLRALGQMASGIAHDFNNALAPILGYSDLLLHGRHITPEKTIEYLQIIRTAAKDSSSVVSRLREFFRYRDEHDVFGPVKLNDLVWQVMALTRPRWRDQALGRGVEIQFVTDLQRVPTVLGSESELREMFVNLVFNASDAIGSGGGTILCRTFATPTGAALQVIDTGCGMTEDVRLRCFEPFFSTKGEQHGSGLGLAMAYGVVRRHDGQIEIESAPGAGTKFTVSLLAYDDARHREPPRETGAFVRPLRILVVDDEAAVREVLAACLSEDGHFVDCEPDAASALQRVRTAPWDIVLTDRAMPRMNGDQLAAEIKRLDPAMPVVMITGFADLMRDVGDQPLAIDAIVRKPFTVESLREGIGKALAVRETASSVAAVAGHGVVPLLVESLHHPLAH